MDFTKKSVVSYCYAAILTCMIRLHRRIYYQKALKKKPKLPTAVGLTADFP
jgi:hypothetical protein